MDWHDSVRYWTSVVFSTSRPGSPAFVSNQSISGVLARSGLDPHSTAGSATGLALSAAVVVIAVIGLRRAIAAGEPALPTALVARRDHGRVGGPRSLRVVADVAAAAR